MKYCVQCGHKIDKDEFCTNCGISIDDPRFNSYSIATNELSNNDNFDIQQETNNTAIVWLILSSLSLLCCSGVFGIFPLVFSIKSTRDYNKGVFDSAINNANIAKILLMIFTTVGIFFNIIFALYIYLSF